MGFVLCHNVSFRKIVNTPVHFQRACDMFLPFLNTPCLDSSIKLVLGYQMKQYFDEVDFLVYFVLNSNCSSVNVLHWMSLKMGCFKM